MPELPDVEIFRQYLNATSLHQQIKKVHLYSPEMLKNSSPGIFQKKLTGCTFTGTSRHGKHLFAELSSHLQVVLHFGMTGFLSYFKNSGHGSSHIRLLIEFTGGYCLAYHCQRKLGLVDVTENKQEYIKNLGLGPDPLDHRFGPENFINILKHKKCSIKSALMNQKYIAGIGNIYADEVLFMWGIHPLSRTEKMDEQLLKEGYRSMIKVLETAIACGANPDLFPSGYLLPFRQEGSHCPTCGGTIARMKVIGRSAYFCEKHQEKIA
ncbi:MAG: Fpg/Nei family DNA glycosylase [Spirochaetota bacterium]